MQPIERGPDGHRLAAGRALCRSLIIAGLLATQLPGCAEDTEPPGPVTSADRLEPGIQKDTAPTPLVEIVPTAPPLQVQAEDIQRQIGTDTFVNPSPGEHRTPPPVGLAGSDELTVNMFDVPLRQAARAVLGDTLGLDYAVAEGVEGRVTVQTSNPVNRRDLFEIFETVLANSGFSITVQNGVYVISQRSGGSSGFRLAKGPVGEGGGVYVVPLRYISAYEMIRILESVTSSTLHVNASSNGNILFASGNRGDIEALLDAVNLFDVDFMRGKSVSRVTLRAASPTEVAAELDAVFDTGEGGSLEGVLRFLPNETLGSILIISSRAQYIAESERWIRSYDEAAGANRQVTIVYRLQNRAAVELETVMQTLLSSGTLSVEGQAGAVVPAVAQAGATDELRVNAGGTARVVADDTANALIVSATAREHEEISRLIEQLDSVAVQVLIEATIAEVTLNDNLDFGVRWFLEHGDFQLGFTPLDFTGVGAILPGFNAIMNTNELKIAINALENVTDVNIVSSPTLLVLDNREAVLNVGDQVPIVTQQSVSVNDPNAPLVNTVEQRDTGVILTIRPRVSSTGRVVLEIEQEVSDVVQTVTSGIDSPTIQQRVVSTSVAVDNGQSIFLGGLIRETRVRSRSQIPILGDIPVLGALFRDTTETDGRTELVIMITPRVITNETEAHQITQEYRGKLSRPAELLNPERPTPKHRFRTIFF